MAKPGTTGACNQPWAAEPVSSKPHQRGDEPEIAGAQCSIASQPRGQRRARTRKAFEPGSQQLRVTRALAFLGNSGACGTVAKCSRRLVEDAFFILFKTFVASATDRARRHSTKPRRASYARSPGESDQCLIASVAKRLDGILHHAAPSWVGLVSWQRSTGRGSMGTRPKQRGRGWKVIARKLCVCIFHEHFLRQARARSQCTCPRSLGSC